MAKGDISNSEIEQLGGYNGDALSQTAGRKVARRGGVLPGIYDGRFTHGGKRAGFEYAVMGKGNVARRGGVLPGIYDGRFTHGGKRAGFEYAVMGQGGRNRGQEIKLILSKTKRVKEQFISGAAAGKPPTNGQVVKYLQCCAALYKARHGKLPTPEQLRKVEANLKACLQNPAVMGRNGVAKYVDLTASQAAARKKHEKQIRVHMRAWARKFRAKNRRSATRDERVKELLRVIEAIRLRSGMKGLGAKEIIKGNSLAGKSNGKEVLRKLALKKARENKAGIGKQIARLAGAKKKVPAPLIVAYLAANARIYRLTTGKKASKARVESWRRVVRDAIANRGGKMPTSLMGNWLKKASGFTGKVLAKSIELPVRMAMGVPKAVGALGVTPLKKTFGSDKKKKKEKKKEEGKSLNDAPRAPVSQKYVWTPAQHRVPAVVTPDIRQYALRMARIKKLNAAKTSELENRLALAQSRRQLAAIEEAEAEKVKQLSDRAEQEEAAAEAEEAGSEADAMTNETESQIGVAYAVMGKALHKHKAVSAHVSKAVLSAAGPFAKLALLGTPQGAVLLAARDVYKEAKADPNAAKLVKELKVKAEAGDEESRKIIAVLTSGKKTDEQLEAAAIVKKELIAEAEQRSENPDVAQVAGHLPERESSLPPIPGARNVYKLAKQGNKEMSFAVKFAYDLLKKQEAGDAAARTKIESYGARAKAGDRVAQLFMAAAAVAAAGIREEKAIERAKNGAGVKNEVKNIQATIPHTDIPVHGGLKGLMSRGLAINSR